MTDIGTDGFVEGFLEGLDPEDQARVRAEMARYNAMSAEERRAEEDRLRSAVENATPGIEQVVAESALSKWDLLAELRERADLSRQYAAEAEGRTARHAAETTAEDALTRCTYLGGCPDFPRAGATAVGHVGIGHGLFFHARDGLALEVEWSDLLGLDVQPTDRAPERVTATRLLAVGLFAWAIKKQRREAILVMKATWGEAYVKVQGKSPVELKAALAPLMAQIVT